MKVSEHFIKKILEKKQSSSQGFFDKRKMESFVTDLYNILFLPEKINTEDQLHDRFEDVQTILFDLIKNASEDEGFAKEQTDSFFLALPDIYSTLILDAESILEFDPAIESLEEILLSYPGFFATYVYRISHQLWIQKVKILPRVISEYAHSKSGIDIHPGAVIGKYFFIDHGTGVVIGETSEIGDNIKLYQGVTLGALSFPKDEKGNIIKGRKRHPTVGNNVVIYSGATLLGAETVIGDNVVIGGNVWITGPVTSGTKITIAAPELKYKKENHTEKS